MKEKARSERLIGTKKRVELNRQVELHKFQKERHKSTIEGQRDSEAGNVDKGWRWDSKTQEERAEIKKVGDKKS